MALPVDGLLSDTPHGAAFRPPRGREETLFEQWERGGIAIQDASRGLDVYDWLLHADADTGEVFAGVPGEIPDAHLYTISPLPVQFSGSFDTNMQPVLAWTDVNGNAFFRWFDPTIPGFDVIQLAEHSRDPHVSLDDVRDPQVVVGVTDTIVAYMRLGGLYYRQLRDRFATEYQLATDLDRWALRKIGMNMRLRMQFQLAPIQVEES